MSHDTTVQRHQGHAAGDPEICEEDVLAEENRKLKRRLRLLERGHGAAAIRFTSCALIAEASEWADALEALGAHRFKQPEALYKTLRSGTFQPEACIVDLDSVPRNLIRALDIRVPCPKLWLGGSAADPDDIKNFGVYYARARRDELNSVIGHLIDIDRAILLPAGIVGKQMLPFLAADPDYRERLHHYTEAFAGANLITLHGDDPVELQLAAQCLAVEAQRARIWEVRSEASIQSVLRKIAQARRPGSDVTIVLSRDIDIESAREFYKSVPSEYSLIKLSARPDNPVGPVSFTLPRLVDRPADTEAWIIWFVCRATIEHGIALSGLDNFVDTISQTLGDDPTIEETRNLCDRSVRQHATVMEEQGEFLSYDDLVHNYERTILRRALTQHDWNLSATARSLGLAESSLRYKLRKLGVARRGDSG